MSEAAAICRKKGWGVGTRLAGDEGYGPTVIQITAVGERLILARVISYDGVPRNYQNESTWTLDCRDWQKCA